MREANGHINRGKELLDILVVVLKELEAAGDGMPEYRAYLHGQVYGMATALRMIYPGSGNLGERAALTLRPALTEHRCHCGEEGLKVDPAMLFFVPRTGSTVEDHTTAAGSPGTEPGDPPDPGLPG